MRRWRGGIRFVVAFACVLAGLVIPLFAVALIVGWVEPDPQGSDMALGLYEVFLGLIAGLLGTVIVTVLSVRWLNGSLRQFWLWMPLAGLAAPVLFGVTLMFARR